MQTQHRYVRIGSHGGKFRYFCLLQNPFLLTWLLYWYGKLFGFRGKGIRQTLGGLKRLFHAVISLCYYQLHSPNADSVIELPVSGHLCLRVHNGYKVFDLRRQKVVKIFSPNIDLAIVRREIERIRRVGTHGFAPTVRRWNVEERWYEEDCVNGYPTPLESLFPLLKSMMLAAPLQEVGALEYAQRRRQIVQGGRSKLSDERLDATKVDTIRSFVDVMINRLHSEGDRRIYLVFSHGDFSPRHVLTGDHGSVIVDWEMVGHRSALFDLYDAFFQRLWGGSTAPGMAAKVENAISQLQLHLALKMTADNSSLISSLDAAEVYRVIYYIECICLYVEAIKKMTQRGLDKILLMIDAYNCYEEILLDGTGHRVGSA